MPLHSQKRLRSDAKIGRKVVVAHDQTRMAILNEMPLKMQFEMHPQLPPQFDAIIVGHMPDVLRMAGQNLSEQRKSLAT